jgi:hypothetical protein
MNIAIDDARSFTPCKSGIGKYTENLFWHIEDADSNVKATKNKDDAYTFKCNRVFALF